MFSFPQHETSKISGPDAKKVHIGEKTAECVNNIGLEKEFREFVLDQADERCRGERS
jgi:hypothetical protein